MSLEPRDVARRLRAEASNTLDLELFEILTYAADAIDGHQLGAAGTCQLVPVVVDLSHRLQRAETALFVVVAERDEILEAIAVASNETAEAGQ